MGYAIDIYQESINKTFREYLVNYDYLTTNFRELWICTFNFQKNVMNINIPNSIGSFNQLFYKMQVDIKKKKKLINAFGNCS